MDWEKLKLEYLRGSASLAALSEKYKVSYRALRRKAAAEKWVELRKKKKAKVEQMVVDSMAQTEADRFARMLDVSDKMLAKLEEIVERFDLEQMAMDKTTAKTITGALKDLKEIQGIKSARDIEEQEARIANLRKMASKDNTDTEIRIRIDSGDEDYGK